MINCMCDVPRACMRCMYIAIKNISLVPSLLEIFNIVEKNSGKYTEISSSY